MSRRGKNSPILGTIVRIVDDANNPRLTQAFIEMDGGEITVENLGDLCLRSMA